jgi:hypothetical protein
MKIARLIAARPMRRPEAASARVSGPRTGSSSSVREQGQVADHAEAERHRRADRALPGAGRDRHAEQRQQRQARDGRAAQPDGDQVGRHGHQPDSGGGQQFHAMMPGDRRLIDPLGQALTGQVPQVADRGPGGHDPAG